MATNYQSDKVSTEQQILSKSHLGYYAGFISRLIAFVIDTVIITISVLAITWFVSVTIRIFNLQAFFNIFSILMPGATSSLEQLIERLTAGFLLAFVIAVYYIFFWIIAGYTPGKAFMGLRIITTDGQKISFFRAILRYLAYFLSAGLFFLGFFWILIDDRRQGWHDKIAGTLVVYTWAARPDERFLAKRIQRFSKRSK
ncbi:MAG: RDD family protein [Anaerolineales bacterium]|nr:RDD family protein [Anaerolineales bacterium]MCK4976010.1 RDD family protein [Anaerolineales bacterium]